MLSNLKFHQNLARITGNLRKDPCTFMTISRWILLEWDIFQTTVVEKIKTHVLGTINFFPKIAPLWDNVEIFVQPAHVSYSFVTPEYVVFFCHTRICRIILSHQNMSYSFVTPEYVVFFCHTRICRIILSHQNMSYYFVTPEYVVFFCHTRIRHMCFACWITKATNTHTQTIQYTATVITRKCLHVTTRAAVAAYDWLLHNQMAERVGKRFKL